MSDAWLAVAVVGAGTMVLKGLGPVALGGRAMPERLAGVIELLAPALLAALVAVQAFADERALVVDERLIGLAAGGVALWRKAPILLVVVVAAATTAVARLII